MFPAPPHLDDDDLDEDESSESPLRYFALEHDPYGIRRTLLGLVLLVLSPVLLLTWLARTIWLRVGWDVIELIGDGSGFLRRTRRRMRATRKWVVGAWKTRSGRNLLLGMPALATSMALLLIWVCACFTSEGHVRARYRTAALQFLHDHQFAAAEICFRRLVQLEGNDPDTRFLLGRTAELAGEREVAADMMSSLAPEDSAGYGPAHLWLALYYWHSADHSPATLERIEKHLLSVVQLDPQATEAHCLLGQLYLEAGHESAAANELALGVKTYPQVAIELARVCAGEGEPEMARTLARRAAAYYAERVRTDPRHEAARLLRADAALFLEDFPAAVQVLEEGLAVEDRASYRQALGSVYWAWAEKVAQDAKASLSRRLQLVSKALHYAAEHPAILQNLVIATEHGRRALPRPLMIVVETRLAEGSAPVGLYLIAGTSAWHQGDKDAARRYLERAYQLDPNDSDVANNLAFVLAQSAAPDLSRAMQLANAALERHPSKSEYLETRQEILARMNPAGGH
jgi:tetratricopeptide (TPR) repeat protein